MKSAVIKISGKTLNEFISTENWISVIKSLYEDYEGITIIHGGGVLITEWSQKLGLEAKFNNGQRATTKEQMNIVAAVQAGLINSQMTAKLNSHGINSIGLSGIDNNTFTADYLDKDMGFVGVPNLTGSVDWILDIMKQKTILVFSSVCRDINGNLMNVNADVFTETLAAALAADSVFFISDVEGVKINGNIKEYLDENEINIGIKAGDITNGMIPKLESCIGLINRGVQKIWIGSSLINYSSKFERKINGGTWIVGSN
jgi:acetylglutamate kinase